MADRNPPTAKEGRRSHIRPQRRHKRVARGDRFIITIQLGLGLIRDAEILALASLLSTYVLLGQLWNPQIDGLWVCRVEWFFGFYNSAYCWSRAIITSDISRKDKGYWWWNGYARVSFIYMSHMYCTQYIIIFTLNPCHRCDHHSIRPLPFLPGRGGFRESKGNGCLKNKLENFPSTAGTAPSRLTYLNQCFL